MENRRGDYYADDEWEEPAGSPSKRARNVYQVSESDQEMDYQDNDEQDHFQNPDAFLNQFGGYEWDHSEDPNDDGEEIDHIEKGTIV